MYDPFQPPSPRATVIIKLLLFGLWTFNINIICQQYKTTDLIVELRLGTCDELFQLGFDGVNHVMNNGILERETINSAAHLIPSLGKLEAI